LTPKSFIVAVTLGISLAGASAAVWMQRGTQSVEAASQEMAGVPVEAATVAVVDFAELARHEALNPPVRRVRTEERSDSVEPPENPSIQSRPPGQPVAEPAGTGTVFPEPSVLLATSPSPRPKVSFASVSGRFIPDTGGAVGLAHVVTSTNQEFQVHDKSTGQLLQSVSLEGFWAPAGVSVVFDPRTYYDRYQDRFITVAVSLREGITARESASILIGISRGSDPTTGWTLFRYAACPTTAPCGSTGDEWWADFPMVGFNKNWVAVRVGMIQRNVAGSINYPRILVANYPALRAAVAGSRPSASVFHWDAGWNDFQPEGSPCRTDSATEEALYWGPNTGGVRLNSLTGTSNAPGLVRGPYVAIPVEPYTVPASAPQLPEPGTGRRVGIGLGTPHECVVRNGHIWTINGVGRPTGSPEAHAGIRWHRLDKTGGYVDGGVIEDATATLTNGGKWYGMANIAVNKNNDVLIGFTQMSSTEYPSAAYAFRKGTDPAGTMRAVRVAKAGEGFYGYQRWGDFSQAQVDPSDDLTMWTIQQYARTPVGTQERFGTWWVSVEPPPPLADGAMAGSVVTSVHFTELRDAVAVLRTRAGLTPFAWTDPTLVSRVTTIKAIHLTELRAALDAVYEAAGRAVPTYTNAAVRSATATVATVDLAELRAAILEVW